MFTKGAWKEQELEAQDQTVKSGATPFRFAFSRRKAGYRLTAQVRDDRERLNETELSLWVAGGKLACAAK